MRGLLLWVAGVGAACAQTADIHPSAPNTIPEVRIRFARDHYELRNATMVDLIRTAWDVKADDVVGGPEWLDLDRFDAIATVPPGASLETVRNILRALLRERFRLAVHTGQRTEPAYEITASRKPKLKRAEDSPTGGCKAQPAVKPNPVTLACQGVTMAEFANALAIPEASGYLFNYSVVDRTGLAGKWDFSVQWHPRRTLLQAPPTAGEVTIFDAFEQQLGLKLALGKVSNSVIVVDRVSEKPTPNALNIAQIPSLRPEFEVADIKPAEPNTPCGGIAVQPGGRVGINMTLRQLILETQGDFGSHRFEGATKGIDGPCFNVVAKVSTFETDAPPGWNGPVWNGLDIDSMRRMIRSMLEDRFGLATHTEQRSVAGYALVAAKPRLHKADAANRAGCKEGPGADGKDPRLANPLASRLVTCRNMTLTQFAAELNRLSWHEGAPVVNETGITGRYDMTINFSPPTAFPAKMPAPAGDAAVPEPTGEITMQQALGKLGLKLQSRQVPTPVLVIDWVNEMPTAN